LEVHEAGDGVDDVSERGAEPPRAGLPEPRDRAVHDVGPDRADGVVVTPEPADHARREILDEDVGVAREVEHDVAPAGLREVERDALLAGIDPREVGGLVAAGLELVRAPTHLVALARPLHLDDPCSQVREQAGAVGAGEHAGQIEDDQAPEGQGIVAHRRSIAEGPVPLPRTRATTATRVAPRLTDAASVNRTKTRVAAGSNGMAPCAVKKTAIARSPVA